MAVVDGILVSPAFSFNAGMASALSMRHVGFRYGGRTTASFSCDDAVGYGYMHEDTGSQVEDIYLTFGMVNSSAHKKFGSTSLLNPAGGRTNFPDNKFKVNAYADFSLEFWALFEDSLDATLIRTSSGAFAKSGMSIYSNVAGTDSVGSVDVTTYTWNHFAFTRTGNIMRGFLNGVLAFSYVSTAAFTLTGIGHVTGGESSRFYIDSIGFSDHYSNYQNNFSPPTLPFYVIPSSSGAMIEADYILVPCEASGSFLTPIEYDTNWSKTALLIRGAGIDGSRVIEDAKNRSVTTTGDVHITGNQTKHVGTSVQFTGSGAFLVIESSSDLDLDYPNENFTIELWVYPTQSQASSLISRAGDLRRGWDLTLNADGRVSFRFYAVNGSDYTLYSNAIQNNQWSFISVTKTGDVYRIRANGIIGDSSTLPYSPYRNVTRMYPGGAFGDVRKSDVPMVIGASSEIANGGNNFIGYMEDIRITIGHSRYPTGDSVISVPDKAFVPTGSGIDGDPYWNDVKALIHFDEPYGSISGIRDARGNTVTAVGAAFVDTRGKHGNRLSLYNASGDTGVKLPQTSDFDLSFGDFTLEFWMYDIVNSGAALAMCQTNTPSKGWAVQWFDTEDSDRPGYHGYVRWSQWNDSGVNDIAISPMHVLADYRWQHVVVQRSGDSVVVYVDGEPGSPLTTSRRPASVAAAMQLGAAGPAVFYFDEFRFTRAARYPYARFIPVAGKYPEYPFVFGQAVISETYSFIPAQPSAAVQVPGAIIVESYSLMIPKVVSPVISFYASIPLPSAATGGEGAGEHVGFSINLLTRQATELPIESAGFDDFSLVQFVAGAGSSLAIGDMVSVMLGNVSVNETMDLLDVVLAPKRAFQVDSSHLNLSSEQCVSQVIPMSEQIGIAGYPIMARNVRVQSHVLFNELVGSQFTFTIILHEGVALSNGEAAFSFGAEAADQMTLSGAAAREKRVVPVLVDGVLLHDSTGGGVNISMVIPEGLQLSDTMTPAQLLALIVNESVQLTDFFSSPTFTTWVMNTRTTAVSEYDGFRFNSFAELGERYLGANEQGLYWLDGGTDDNSPIESVIQPGVIQPHGNKLSHVINAYLGMRGDSDFVFTITDEAGGSFAYRLDANSMKTGKVPFGRGLKTRYFTFNMRSMGGDFDLDNIEFITQETARKVQR